VDQEIDINSITRIKFLMEYDVRKSPCENILSEQPRIRGTVSPQQSDPRINLGQFTSGSQSTPKDPYNAQLKPLDSRYNTIYDVPTDPPSGWDHDIAGWTELGLTGLGAALMMTGYLAPVGVALVAGGTSVGIADALHYFKEGKDFDGWLMLALQAIPGNELIKSPSFRKLVPELGPIMKKMADNKWLTDAERKIYEEGAKLFKKILPQLSPFLRKQSFLLIRKILRQLPLLKVLKLYRALAKVPAALGKLVIKVLRISITFDQLWILMTKLDPSMKRTRDKSEFAQMLDALYKLPPAVIDMMFKAKNLLYNSDGTDNLEGQQQFTDACTTDEFINGYVEVVGTEFNEDIKTLIDTGSVTYDDGTTIKYTPPPVTIESILSGKQTIRKGQKGEVVEEIQKMLLLLGYDLGETGKKGAGIDRDFGDTTERAVIKFQTDNNLKDTSGIVGKETLGLLKKQFDKAIAI
jgi:hypothetical protein